MLDTLPKHGEFTYGINRSVVSAVIKNNAFTIATPTEVEEIFIQLDEGVMGSRRSLNNDKELFRQGIGYLIPYRFTTEDYKPKLKFMVYKRTKANVDGGIVDKFSLGAGGHIETCDTELHSYIENNEALVSQVIDFRSTLENSMVREFSEEVGCYAGDNTSITESFLGASSSGPSGIGFVMDGKTTKGYVGNIHFGAVYCIELPEEITRVNMLEPQNELVGFFGVDELTHMLGNKNAEFEPWSEMIVNQIKEVETHILNTFYEFVKDSTEADVSEWKNPFAAPTVPESEPVVEVPEVVEKVSVDITPDELRVKLESIVKGEWTKVDKTPYLAEDDYVRILASNIKHSVVSELSHVLQEFTVSCKTDGKLTTIESKVGFKGKSYDLSITLP